MKSVYLIVAASAGMIMANGAVPANELRQNYQSIIERNPFGLKPIPEPPKAAPPQVEQKKPDLEYFLTGITTVGYPKNAKRAYIMTRQAKGGQKEPNYYGLREQEGADGIEVLSIDSENRRVKVKTPDGEMMLSFVTHGVPAPAGSAGAVAGMPGAPGVGMPGQPGAIPAPPGSRTAYGRPLPTANNAAVAGGNTYNRTTIPPRTVRTRGANTGRYGDPSAGGTPPALTPGQGQPQDAPEPVDPALQYINLRLQQEEHRMQGLPFPPIPQLE